MTLFALLFRRIFATDPDTPRRRTIPVEAAPRALAVAGEARTLDVEAEPRTLVVEAAR